MTSSSRGLLCFLINICTGLPYTDGYNMRLQVLEGNTVTIFTGLTGIQSDAQILWFYRPENTDIKIVNSLDSDGEITEYNRERFGDRLQLNRSSGSLTIRNISREDSGVYLLQIITGRSSEWSFSLNVYAVVPPPSITSASGPRCSVLCSAESQREMTLSWFKGTEMLSQTKASDLSVKLTLPLEVNDEEGNYSCVSSNLISNRTAKFNMAEICSQGAGDINCCIQVECIVRLALSALVTLILVALLIDHFKRHSPRRSTTTRKP